MPYRHEVTEWYYIDGPRRVGPVSGPEWASLLREGTIAAETLVWHEGLEKWTPFRLVDAPESEPFDEPEDVEEPAAVPAAPAAPELPDALEARILSTETPLPIRATLREGWRLFTRYPGLLVSVTLLVHFCLSLALQVPLLQMAVPLVLDGAITAGLYTVYLRLLRDEPAGFGSLLAGFRSGIFGNLALKTLVANLVMIACFLPLVLTMEKWGLSQGADFKALLADPTRTAALGLLAVMGGIPALFLTFCWLFAVPLIADRGLPFGQAMRLSRRKVLQTPWRLAGLLGLAGLLTVLPAFLILFGVSRFAPGDAALFSRGMAAASFAVMLVLPLYLSTLLKAYETLFPPRPAEQPPTLPPAAQ